MALELAMQSLSLDPPNGTLQLEPAFAIQPERVARLLLVADITDGILRSTDSILDILAFRLTCHLARRAADVYTARAYDMDRALLGFFGDPAGFRWMQADTGTLISGSFAVQYFERAFYPEADMDLYAHPGFALAVGEWLHSDGYRLVDGTKRGGLADRDFWRGMHNNNWTGLGGATVSVPHDDDPLDGNDSDEYGSDHVDDVYTWHKPKATGGLPLVVQVISCKRSPLQTIVAFHSTVVLNVISHQAAYAFYPLSTFGHHHGLELLPTATPAAAAHQKYRDRGWTIDCSRTGGHYYPSKTRWPTDVHTWVIPSPCPGLAPDRPDSLRANSFVLQGVDRYPYSVSSGILVHPALRLQYAVADALVLRDVEHTLEFHWRVNRRRLEALSVRERYRQWIWMDDWAQKKLIEAQDKWR
ncbi:hypothetical protein FIBSPDRAFT_81987 [Athelia psychrophila]|uniref:Uncharacterized protein n=1 Tax=Athelia psychrophila TaxID=1759441 RepID=A0A166E6J0_9AGAM|nr:hypothetical protein FIBSPDRAFT_81987 [Fibularhizoctonia sp. CBS 109695]